MRSKYAVGPKSVQAAHKNNKGKMEIFIKIFFTILLRKFAADMCFMNDLKEKLGYKA